MYTPPLLDDVSLLYQQLRRYPRDAGIWLRLAEHYASARLQRHFAYAARQASRLNASLGPRLNTLGFTHDTQGHALGELPMADAAALLAQCDGATKNNEGDWLSWLYMARCYEVALSEETDSASRHRHALAQAVQYEPILGESLHQIGMWRLEAGNVIGAIEAFTKLLRNLPTRYGSMMMLGEALLRNGQPKAAEQAFTKASFSDSPELLVSLANRVFRHNYWREAIEVLNKAKTLRPNDVGILVSLSKIHWEVYQLTEAKQCCDQILALAPDNQEVIYMLAALPGRMGDAKKHFELVKKKYDIDNDPTSRLASSVAMSSLYIDSFNAKEVAALHKELVAPIEKSLLINAQFDNSKDCQKKVKVGFVTSDLHRQHPVTIFLLPMLSHFKTTHLELSIYYTGSMYDDHTLRAKQRVQHWIEAGAMDDAALRLRIMQDGIDILIDLSGHTSHHRLGLFAMRSAPIQVSYLGYPHSTGMSTIDWMIGDPWVSPAQHAHLFSEGIAQMPSSVFCWAPDEVYPLPKISRDDDVVVFGSFNNAMKLSPTTIDLWAKVMQAVPKSKLLLKAPSFRDQSVQQRFVQCLATHGIGPDRLIIRGPSGLYDMMQEYADIDLALDPTPYNGGTTTLQALWMGVPVVTLEGDNFVSRMGTSFLQSLGQADWIAKDHQMYIRVAKQLSGRVPELRKQRQQLRNKLINSPLGDIKSFVEHFEALLLQMWKLYCEQKSTRLITVRPI